MSLLDLSPLGQTTGFTTEVGVVLPVARGDLDKDGVIETAAAVVVSMTTVEEGEIPMIEEMITVVADTTGTYKCIYTCMCRVLSLPNWSISSCIYMYMYLLRHFQTIENQYKRQLLRCLYIALVIQW